MATEQIKNGHWQGTQALRCCEQTEHGREIRTYAVKFNQRDQSAVITTQKGRGKRTWGGTHSQ
eukprot:9263922-Ditylum_brightwellii.AAC.1